MRLARQKLGLSVRKMAEFLKTDPQSVRRMEMSPEYSTARKPPPRIEEIIIYVLEK
jgi:ribosome-binding protein aMBF1 (putative translation factor)